MHLRRNPRRVQKFQTRTDAEWARVLDLHHIRWTYMPAPTPMASWDGNVTYQFEFHLPVIRTFLDTKGTSAEREPLERCRGTLDWGNQIILGSNDGSFQVHPSFFSAGDDFFYFCPKCRKSFFFRNDLVECGHCSGNELWIQDRGKLSWFGYAGNAKPMPRSQERTARSIPPIANQKPEPNVNLETMAPQLYKEEEAKVAKSRESGNWEQLRGQLSGMPLVHVWPGEDQIEALAKAYPNFAEVCGFIITEIRLAKLKPDKAVNIPNILLVGSPSCGKSSFTAQLAHILVGDDHTRIDLGQQATSFALIGTDSGFARAKEGRILRAMAGRGLQRPVSNPLIIFDEMDKVRTGGLYDPLPALLSVLEKRDAKRFVDEFFVVPVDASGLIFVGLANDLSTVVGPLASRFITFSIPDYTPDQFTEVVIPNIYQDWRMEFHEGTFPEQLCMPTRQEIARQAGFQARQVRPVLNRLVASGLEEFWPRPTWENLRTGSKEEERH